MPFNGSGSFTPDAADFPAVSGTIIESGKFNNVINDLSTGLSTAITKDGQTTITGDIPLNGHKITGLGAGAIAGDAINYTQLTASSGLSIVGFKRAGANSIATTGQAELRDYPLTAQSSYGATGTGAAHDDTTYLQNLISDAITAGAADVYIPPNATGSYYKTTAPLTATKAITIKCSGAAGCTIIATGLSVGQFILDFNCAALDVVQHVHLEGITLRSDNQSPTALRLKNVSYFTSERSQCYHVKDGVNIQGTNCFSNRFSMFTCYDLTGYSVRFVSYTGGGNFKFESTTFTGDVGFHVDTASTINNLSFDTCNWEQCVTQSMLIEGTVEGLSIVAPRTEGCNGSDFVIYPSAANHVHGLSITGGFFNSDSAGSPSIVLGGGGGNVKGFNIAGNTANIITTSFVQLNGGGDHGCVKGNFINTATGTAVNAPRATVEVTPNGNTSGALPDYYGVTPATFTATATGMTTAPTGTVKYTIIGNVVTLDIPFITGTSNATTFTLTGAPASIYPAADKDLLVRIQDNSGATQMGLLRVKTTGVLELYSSVAGAVFTAAATKSSYGCSVSYTLA